MGGPQDRGPQDRGPQEPDAPSDDAEHEALARAVLDDLAAAGADPTQPLALDFFVVAPSEAVAHVVIVRTVAMGFATTVARDGESGEWICSCRVTLVPAFERVVALGRLLDRLARELGGFAEGFGAAGAAGD